MHKIAPQPYLSCVQEGSDTASDEEANDDAFDTVIPAEYRLRFTKAEHPAQLAAVCALSGYNPNSMPMDFRTVKEVQLVDATLALLTFGGSIIGRSAVLAVALEETGCSAAEFEELRVAAKIPVGRMDAHDIYSLLKKRKQPAS